MCSSKLLAEVQVTGQKDIHGLLEVTQQVQATLSLTDSEMHLQPCRYRHRA